MHVQNIYIKNALREKVEMYYLHKQTYHILYWNVLNIMFNGLHVGDKCIHNFKFGILEGIKIIRYIKKFCFTMTLKKSSKHITYI